MNSGSSDLSGVGPGGEYPLFAGLGLQEPTVATPVEYSYSLLDFNPTRTCELLVGLHDVNSTEVDDRPGGPIVVNIEAHLDQVWSAEFGARAGVKERPIVQLVDLPCFGRPAPLVCR